MPGQKKRQKNESKGSEALESDAMRLASLSLLLGCASAADVPNMNGDYQVRNLRHVSFGRSPSSPVRTLVPASRRYYE